jgi:DNA polymerase alpha subunit A
LTKAPQDYSDFKSLPHVGVAMRQKAKGKSDTELVGNFIPYVICNNTETEIDSKAGLAAKAFHPEELMD